MLDQAVNDMREDVTKMRQAAAQVSGLLSDSWHHVLAMGRAVSACAGACLCHVSAACAHCLV